MFHRKGRNFPKPDSEHKSKERDPHLQNQHAAEGGVDVTFKGGTKATNTQAITSSTKTPEYTGKWVQFQYCMQSEKLTSEHASGSYRYCHVLMSMSTTSLERQAASPVAKRTAR